MNAEFVDRRLRALGSVLRGKEHAEQLACRFSRGPRPLHPARVRNPTSDRLIGHEPPRPLPKDHRRPGRGPRPAGARARPRPAARSGARPRPGPRRTRAKAPAGQVRSSGVPAVPGPVYGLRSWRTERGGSLRGFFSDEPWETGPKATRARCTGTRGHRAPASHCGCGLYALHPTVAQCEASFEARRASRARPSEPPSEVVGIIAAWGEVHLHETGFRAQYARPHAFLLPGGASMREYGERVKALAASHGAQVLEVASGRELHRLCRRENLGLSSAVVGDLLGVALRRRELVRRWRGRFERCGSRLARRWDGLGELGRPVAELAAMAVAVVIGAVPWLLALWVVVAAVRGSEEDPDAGPSRTPRSPSRSSRRRS